MRTVVYNLPSVSKFVSDNIPGEDEFSPDDPNIGLLKNGKLIAGVVFNNYCKSSICMHVAATEGGWLNKEFLRACFRYPFHQLKVNRITALVRTDNEAALKFDTHLGFKKEGLIRRGDDDGCDLHLLGMLPEDCKWKDI